MRNHGTGTAHDVVAETHVDSTLFRLDSPSAVNAPNLTPGDSFFVDLTITPVLRGGQTFALLESGDVSGDGAIDTTDLMDLIDYMFVGGPAPACPR